MVLARPTRISPRHVKQDVEKRERDRQRPCQESHDCKLFNCNLNIFLNLTITELFLWPGKPQKWNLNLIPDLYVLSIRWTEESQRLLRRYAKTLRRKKAWTTSEHMNLWSMTRWRGSASRVFKRRVPWPHSRTTLEPQTSFIRLRTQPVGQPLLI